MWCLGKACGVSLAHNRVICTVLRVEYGSKIYVCAKACCLNESGWSLGSDVFGLPCYKCTMF